MDEYARVTRQCEQFAREETVGVDEYCPEHRDCQAGRHEGDEVIVYKREAFNAARLEQNADTDSEREKKGREAWNVRQIWSRAAHR